MTNEHTDCAHAIQQAEAEARRMKKQLLDEFAIAALASGRYAYTQVYDIARLCLEERDKHVKS